MVTSAVALDHSRAAAVVVLLLLLLLLLSSTASSLPTPTPTPSYRNISYFHNFSDPDSHDFILGSNSYISNSALQITPDSLRDPELLINKSSRSFYSHRFKLYDTPTQPNSTTHVASFSTSFKINVFPGNSNTAGEGLAFLIAPSTDDSPLNSHSGYLGLTNATLEARTSNQFIAVEFDTVQQYYDPNNNHVGLNINSVDSNITANLTAFGIEIAPVNITFYTVWIDYSGVNRYITVYMNLSENKPSTPVLSAPLDLSAHLNQFSYFGFAASTGINYELNCVLSWNLTVEYLPSGGGWPAWKLAAAIIPSLLVAIIAFTLFGRYIMRRTVWDDPNMVEKLKNLQGMPREFTFKELKRATNNFNERRKLGQGGFGVVYKGVIPGENVEVAVKKFSRERVSSQDDFLKELTIINRLRHKHLVPLLGWCHKNNMLLLVYEFMPNGSLDQHIYTGDDCPILSWDRRYNIIEGLASALHYLHDEFDQKVVHRDLKASNVMLDASFNARLGDFGLARAIDSDKTSYADLELGGVPGTPGYIAPECLLTGKATRQSDVFGFGAVMLEVACGRRPHCEVAGSQFLSEWVWRLYREGRILDAIDEKLAGDYEAADAERLLMLALACSHPIPGERPKTLAIVQILSRAVAVPDVPPFKPAFVWPSGPVEEEDNSTGTTTLTNPGVNSSFYTSSGGWPPQMLSRENVARMGL